MKLIFTSEISWAFRGAALFVFLFIFSLNGCKGEAANKINFKGLKNIGTMFPQDLGVVIQYGVNENGIVEYLVVTSGLNSSALLVTNSLSEHGERRTFAMIEIGSRQLPPPDTVENFVYCDRSGVFRGKLKKLSEDELQRQLKAMGGSDRASFLGRFANETSLVVP